jgi:rhamnosyltransferase
MIQPRNHPSLPAGPAPSVTVIMRSKNSADTIGQALSALFAQRCRDFELLVVDSGSTDRTLEIVRRYPARLIEIAPTDYYPGPVLNLAIAESRSEIVVFQNSDVVPLTADALGALLAPFDDPAVQAAFARQVPRPEAHTWVRRDYAAAFPATGDAPSWLPYSLPFAAMRKSAWRTRPFYSDAWGSEDTEWGAWARRAGHRIVYAPDAQVMHSHNYTLRQLFGRRFIEGEADAFVPGTSGSALALVARTLTAVAHDVAWHLHARDLGGLARVPARRLVYHWAYYRGYRHGAARRARGDRDASVGQQVVLSRYEG